MITGRTKMDASIHAGLTPCWSFTRFKNYIQYTYIIIHIYIYTYTCVYMYIYIVYIYIYIVIYHGLYN